MEKDSQQKSNLSHSETIESKKLPYNPKNKLLNDNDVLSLFQQYGLLGTKPQDMNLYRTAMVHTSYCIHKNQNVVNGNKYKPDNCLPLQEESYERLEFLGDSIISAVVSMYLFERYPNKDNQGFLSYIRSKIINGNSLAYLCSKTIIPEFIIVSDYVHKKGVSKNILEDVFESFVGALYVDTCSLDKCYIWLTNIIEKHVDFVDIIQNLINK